jgi:hypothetical protein
VHCICARNPRRTSRAPRHPELAPWLGTIDTTEEATFIAALAGLTTSCAQPTFGPNLRGIEVKTQATASAANTNAAVKASTKTQCSSTPTPARAHSNAAHFAPRPASSDAPATRSAIGRPRSTHLLL